MGSRFSSVETGLRRCNTLIPLFSLGRRKLIPSLEHVTASEPTVTPISAAISSRAVPRSTRFLICWIRSGVNFNGLPLGTGLLTVPSDNALRAELCIVNPRAPRRSAPICYGRQPRQNPPYQRAPHRLNRGGFVICWHPGAEEILFSDIPDSPSRMGAVRPPAPTGNKSVGREPYEQIWVALQRVAPANILALCRGLEHRGVLNGGNHNGMPIGRGRSFSEPRVKTPNQCPRFAIRMKYRGGERITPLPLTQDMIRQLALEAEFRGLNVGELVGGLVRATIVNNLVRQVLDPRAKRPDPVRQPTAAQRGTKKPRRKSLGSLLAIH